MAKPKKRPSSDGEVKQVSFVIHGEDFTRLARERLLDDNPGSAWRIASGLIGSDESAGQELNVALALLKGDKKLVGKNEMELVDEDQDVAKKHKERVAWLYAGRIQYNGKWCRPVAQVTSYGIRDMTNDRRIEVRKAGAGKGFYNREWHYCGTHEVAPLADVSHTKYHNVIFEECGELPHWMTPPLDFEAAIKQWEAAGRQLEERGHHMLYPSRKKAADVDDDIEYDRFRDDEDRREAEAMLAEERYRADVMVEERRIARVRMNDKLDDLEAQYAAEDAMRDRLIAGYREKILAQAGDDMLVLAWGDEEVTDEELGRDRAWGIDRKREAAGCVKVPRAPFLYWAFDRLKQYDHVKPPWTVVSPVGLKMGNDNPYHTDWVIGAGFDPKDRRLYNGPIARAAMHLAFIQQERFHAETGVHVLSDGEHAIGLVEHGKPNKRCTPGAIVVLPNLHPRYLEATINAAAVITEEGGETAHLAQVGRERRLAIVRIPGAREKYSAGDQIAVSTARRAVEHL